MADTTKNQAQGQKQAGLAAVVIAVGVVAVGVAVVAMVAVLSALPNQRALMTPVAVNGTPLFAPDVETRVAAVSENDMARGELLFNQYTCTTCHHIDDGTYSTGPNLKGLGERAATRRDFYSAAAYIYEAITQPNAFVVPDYPAGVMVQNFKQSIPDNDLYILIAWLLRQ